MRKITWNAKQNVSKAVKKLNNGNKHGNNTKATNSGTKGVV